MSRCICSLDVALHHWREMSHVPVVLDNVAHTFVNTLMQHSSYFRNSFLSFAVNFCREAVLRKMKRWNKTYKDVLLRFVCSSYRKLFTDTCLLLRKEA